MSKIDIHDSWKLWNSFGYFVGRKALQNSVDIAILTLSRRAPRSINPVCLPSDPSNTYVGYDAVVAVELIGMEKSVEALTNCCKLG